MSATDLPDLNVWLALADPDHEHHSRAESYWNHESANNMAFCRVTMLGILRLLTNRSIMRNNPFTPVQAWRTYRAFMALPEIVFLEETHVTEPRMASWSDTLGFSPQCWTDAWLAALALSHGARVVSFDTDFTSFQGLSFFHLKI